MRIITTTMVAEGQRAKNSETMPEIKVRYITTSDLTRRAIQKENARTVAELVSASRNIPLSSFVGRNAFQDCPRVWIIGGGPSLKGFDFSKLDGEVVIGVNRSFEHEVVGISCSMDLRFIRWLQDGKIGRDEEERANTKLRWKTFKGAKVMLMMGEPPVTKPDEEPVYIVHRPNISGGEPDLDMHQISIDMLSDGNNSGQMSLQLAIALGARDIHLLGFDMHGDSTGGQSWYHSGYPQNQGSHVYTSMLKSFEKIGTYCREHDIRVTNHSENSALRTFNIEDLSSAYEYLKNRQQRPVVVGYFTEGTPYEKEIRGMEQSARFFGLTTRIYAMPNQGEWHKNCLLKPTVIQMALDEFPDKPILFLDADSRIRRYPVLFDTMKAHFAYCEFDWAEVPGSTRTGKEVSSAVLYMKPTKSVHNLVENWKDAADRCISDGQQVFDQKILEKLLSSWRKSKGTLTEQLPMSYDQIFDSMAGLGDPVIEQLQASRRMKGKVGV